MTAIVGLSGLARSGKDAAAEALVADGWERRALADPIRDFLFALNPIIEEVRGARTQEAGRLVSTVRLADLVRSYGWEKAKAIPEVRELMQRCGTEAGRAVLGDTIWIDTTLRDIGERPVVVTDCRYPNEVQAIRDLGGIVVRIERPGIEAPRQTDGSVHVTERALHGVVYDETLHNDGSLADLHDAIRMTVLDIFGFNVHQTIAA